MANYYKRLWGAFWRDFKKSTGEQMLGALLAVCILTFQIRYQIIRPGEIRANLGAIAWPYAILVGALLVWHLVKAPHVLYREHLEARTRAERWITDLEQKLFDEQPRFSIKVGMQPGSRDAWLEQKDANGSMVYFILEHHSGRVPEHIRFDPVVSVDGQFSLRIWEIASASKDRLSGENLYFEVWPFGVRPESDMELFQGAPQGRMLDIFVSSRPEGQYTWAYPLTVRYNDRGDERIKKFEIEFNSRRYWFTVRESFSAVA
jgi:hypothetical protein